MKDNSLIWIIAIIAIILLVKSNQGVTVNLGDTNIGGTNIDSNTDDVAQAVVTDGGIDICKSYDTNYPNYFFVKQVQCEATGGTYICNNDALGCYDITTWDNTLCNSAQVQVLKAMCASMGADWTCTAVEISCEK